MQKKSKKAKTGFTEVDLIPLIGHCEMKRKDNTLLLTIELAAQNPGLNPSLFLDAVRQELPDCAPDFMRACRIDILDSDNQIFEAEFRKN